MGAHRFTIGARFQRQGRSYEIKKLLPDGQLLLEDIATSMPQIVVYNDLVSELFAGDIRFEISGKHTKPTATLLTTDVEHVALDEYPDHLVAIARYRYASIRPLLNVGHRTRATIQAYVDAYNADPHNQTSIQQHGSLSIDKVYRWMRDYSKAKDIRTLIPSYQKRGGNKQRLDTLTNEIINQVIEEKFWVAERVTIDDIRQEVAVRIAETNRYQADQHRLKLPSRDTIHRRLQSLDPLRVIEVKQGKQAARRLTTQYGQVEYPTIPLSIVEIDHTVVDVIVVDAQGRPIGRPTLTYMIDIATRSILGFYLGFAPPSVETVMACLFHAITPKTNLRQKYPDISHEWLAYGIPQVLRIDNGKEFVGRDLQDACDILGIEIDRTPPRTPEAKATIERGFGSLNSLLFHKLPGTTFSNPHQRKSKEYASEKRATFTLDALEHILTLFVTDYYSQRYHRGLNNTPAQAWLDATKQGFLPSLPSNVEELRIVLGKTAMRSVRHTGIELEGLRYNCDALAGLRQRLGEDNKVKVKINLHDISTIFVHDPFTNRYIDVPALAHKQLQGVSLWQYKVLRRNAHHDEGTATVEGLGRARRKIDALITQQSHSKKSAGKRAERMRSAPSQASREVPSIPSQVPNNTNTPYSNPNDDFDWDDTGDWGIEPGALPKSRT